MTEKREVKRIFIGSPGDLKEEREIFRDVVEEVNRIKAHGMGIELEAVGWEDTQPREGRPQELINQDLKECDLMILLLWKRWGSETGEKSSGFLEEYELAKELNEKNGTPEIKLYFKSVPDVMLEDVGPQLRPVLDFRDKIEREKKFLFYQYEDEKQWGKTFREHLCLWLDGIKPEPLASPGMTEKLQQIEKLEKELEESRSKEEEHAYKWADEAQEHADNGRLTKAEEYFARAISAHPFPSIINYYGQFLYRIGSLVKAEEKFKQLLVLGDSTLDKELIAVAYGNLGLLYQTQGDLNRAEIIIKKSLKIDEELNRKEGMASQYGNLGLIYQTRGDLDEAEKMHKKSLEINKEFGHKKGMAIQYGNLGIIHHTRGDLDEAEKMHKKSLEINEEHGLKEGMASQYGNLALIYKARGDLDGAEKILKKSYKIFEELGLKTDIARYYGNLGLIYRNRGDLDGAEKMIRKALAIDEQLGYKEGIAADYGNLGNIYLNRDKLKDAEKYYNKALVIEKELKRKGGMANTFCNLGIINKMSGDFKKAKTFLGKSLSLYSEIGAKRDIEDIKTMIKGIEDQLSKQKK